MAGSHFAEVLHLFPCNRKYEQLQPLQTIQLSPVVDSTCSVPQVAALKPFPGAAANPVWSGAHVLARGAIRGLTLPRGSLLKTDRLSGTPRSSHLKHAAIASCCRNDHAPVIRTRESPLVRKRVGLQIKSRETSKDDLCCEFPICRHAFLCGTPGHWCGMKSA